MLSEDSGEENVVTSVLYRKCLVMVLCSFLSLPAFAEITISEGYVRALPPGQPNTAAFMEIHNSADRPVNITAVRSDAARLAELHAHHHRNGMMRMEQVEFVVVPAKGSFTLEPGDHHLMLIDLHRPLKEGDQVKIVLEASFSSGEAITISEQAGQSRETISVNLPVRSVLNEHKHH